LHPLKQNIIFKPVLRIRIGIPHQSEKLDPERDRIKVKKPDPDPHRREGSDPDPKQSEITDLDPQRNQGEADPPHCYYKSR
jgi:hypothetical protein